MHIWPIRGEPEGELLELSRLLDAWDPIGVYDSEDWSPASGGTASEVDPDAWPAGEYNDLLVPILSELRAGATSGELAQSLRECLHSDYGLDATTSDAAEKIVAWWHARSVPDEGSA